jgi:hypothetical protein
MTTTERILTTFTSKVDMEKEYTRSELGKMLTEVFKEMKEVEKGEKPKKKKVKKTEDGEEKKKREPTLYNLFVKDTMSVVKEENPEMSRQDLMREVGRMWKEKKGEVVNEEDVKEEEVVANEEMLDDKKGKKGKKEKNEKM